MLDSSQPFKLTSIPEDRQIFSVFIGQTEIKEENFQLFVKIERKLIDLCIFTE